MNFSVRSRRLSRRQFLATASAGCAGAMVANRWVSATESRGCGPLCFGLVADVHYADIPVNTNRYYAESQIKLREAVEVFNRRKVAFAVELGDFCDAGASKEADIGYLHAIRDVYEQFDGPRHYVVGNHCVVRFSKDEFLEHCGASIKQTYYSFDQGPYHFVVLDANFRPDETPYCRGNFHWTKPWVPVKQQQWLADDLKRAGDKRAIVFIHQTLHNEQQDTGVKNAPDVRRVLESAGNVEAVFQGHKHEGDYAEIAGIHYVTLRAMVLGPAETHNTYAVVTLQDDRIVVESFDKKESRTREFRVATR